MNFFFLMSMLTYLGLLLAILLAFLMTNFSVVLDFELVSFNVNSFSFILFFDSWSMIFFTTVMLISLSVFLFSSSYMNFDKYYIRFHYLLLSFVISMVLLILSPNLVSIILGWDGLGVSSYLLVIYYSSVKSYNAGMITIMSNRIGDALIIICLGGLMYMNTMNIFMLSYMVKMDCYWVLFMFIVAACTKSAQIPFSAWLPAAMAAPTPVSSLVHSSTLVTAGVYLIFRFENLFILLDLNWVLLVVGCLTMFMASLSAFFEMDMKKMVALSTLSQLGVMIMAMGAGFFVMGFFHLLAHAFFKAVLFISAGNLIHSSESYQDLRVMGGMAEVLPFSKSVVIGASLSLCGLPFMSAFYSKEMIIESLLMFNFSVYLYFIMMLGVMMTIFYSLRFLVMSFMWVNRQRSLFNKADLDFSVNFSMMILIIPAIMGGSVIGQKFMSFPMMILVNPVLKYITITIIITSSILFYLFMTMGVNYYSVKLWGGANLWGLPFLSSRILITSTMNWGDYFQKYIDFSWMYFMFTNFITVPFKWQVIESLVFTNYSFIRILNNMFLFVVILLYFFW